MKIKDIAKISLDKLMELGADRASVKVNRNFSSELQKEFNGIDLFRDVDAIEVELNVIQDDKRGLHQFTYSEKDDIEINVRKALNSASESNPDKAYGMAKNMKYKQKYGIDRPDTDAMYKILSEFEVEKDEKFPEITDTTSVVFYQEEICYLNSLDSEIEYSNGYYHILSLFSAAKDGNHSSMNFCYQPCTQLPQSILSLSKLNRDYQDTIRQMHQQSFSDKFQGQVILNPMVACQLMNSVIAELQGLPLIDKNSLFLDKINEKIFNPKFSIKSYANHPELVNKDIFNAEGYLNKDDFLIQNGELKNFIVSEYVANRSDYNLNTLASECYEISSGTEKLDDMIKSIKKGILVNGISMGNPNKNKDFSGVIKNSYYIEDGKIQYPINEVMMTANIVEMFNNIEALSQENENIFGSCIAPWMKISGVNIAGK